jgi:DNA primase
MRFSPSFLDEIRDRVPISSVVGQRVTFDRKKSNPSRGDFWGCCPFHGEKSPSFHCEDRKGRYHCFGCGVSGDHFRFLTELEGIAFPEAVERIAAMAGVPMPARDPEAEKRESERASLHDVMELAATFFEEQLQSSAGAKARAYLRGRGLSPAIQHTFRLGYAPDSRNALKAWLAGKGVTKDDVEACGLVVFGPDVPVSYDRFRDRVMFPIEDVRGRVIAFGGRALSSDVPAKYLNSPETELFHKGRVLYNAARARKAQGATGAHGANGAKVAAPIIAVEGYMDVIALAQAGFASVVAPLGTALTEDQLDLLWRMTPEPVLCFDGDQAGLRAAFRAASLALPALKPGRSLRFALLPEGKDPDDLVRQAGAEAFAAVLEEARPLADMIWRAETSGATFETPERRAELEGRLKQVVGVISDESVRRHYLQDMRERMHQFFGSLGGANRGAGRGRQQGAGRGPAAGRLAISDRLAHSPIVRRSGDLPALREAAIVLALVNHPRLVDEFFEAVAALDLAHGELKRLHGTVLDALAETPSADRAAIVRRIAAAGQGDFFKALALQAANVGLWTASEQAAEEDACEGLRQALYLHRRARALHMELKAAEAALATEPTEENYEHLLELQGEIRGTQAMDALIEGFGSLSGKARRNA